MMLRTNYVDYLNVECFKDIMAVLALNATVIGRVLSFVKHACYGIWMLPSVFNILVLWMLQGQP